MNSQVTSCLNPVHSLALSTNIRYLVWSYHQKRCDGGEPHRPKYKNVRMFNGEEMVNSGKFEKLSFGVQ